MLITSIYHYYTSVTWYFVLAQLFVKVPRSGDSEGTFLVFIKLLILIR